ncbi:hypothetical protein SAMN05216352_102161 [Alteribacillus bidgolensis]|uniref:Uncharacterized protein n=1 Tax=Alteribacillus bidgolensis TaxID=930129 RepID=A0A1G8ECL9_9BACI|nr:hypothetical protein SAMN05216352_102161 [Alteribacillus bidgolensis]
MGFNIYNEEEKTQARLGMGNKIFPFGRHEIDNLPYYGIVPIIV